MKSWIEISQHALLANYRTLTRAASPTTGPATPVLAVVKANAYGHSLALCAPVLAAAGAPWLGVTDAQEGICARAALTAADIPLDAQPQILIMSGLLPEDAAAILHHRLTPAVWTPRQLDWLTHAAQQNPTAAPLPIHLEIDTGMSRQGARPGPELAAFLEHLAASPHLYLGGIFTHFASAEIANSPQTLAQQRLFEAALDQMRPLSIFHHLSTSSCQPFTSSSTSPFEPSSPLWLHASNSSALDLAATPPWLNTLAASFNARPLARAGLALYGHCLPLQPTHGPAPQAAPHLLPVLTWKTRIIDLRNTAPDAAIGYNATFATTRSTRLALLPTGYADGLRRELSSTSTQPSGWVMLHGQRAPILGRISMNLTTIDVTHIPTANIGDEVILLGPGITAEDHARLARTIPYEILCALRAAPHLVPEGSSD